jgi:uncharacterized protein (DUF58 family)
MERASNNRDLHDPRSTIHDPRWNRWRLPVWGRYYLLVAILLLGVGLHRNINLLMLLGYALLTTALLNLRTAGRSVRGLRGSRRFAEWMFARAPCAVEVRVSNPGRRPRFGLRLEDGGPDRAAIWFLDRLAGRESQNFRRGFVPSRRGRYEWGAVTVGSGYPFGIVERRFQLTAAEEVLVLPALGWLHRGRFLRHLRAQTAQPQRVSVRQRPRSHPAAQAEFHGLRPYRVGDSPRRIHWRTSAHRGELMVREFEDEPSDNLLLVFDPTLPDGVDSNGVAWRERFEEAVSLAATICWEWCRRRGDQLGLAIAGANPVVLDGLTGPIHARRVLERLAVVECVKTPVDAASIGTLKTCSPQSAIVVLIALGRSLLADSLSRALGGPVNQLDVTIAELFDFYTPPC